MASRDETDLSREIRSSAEFEMAHRRNFLKVACGFLVAASGPIALALQAQDKLEQYLNARGKNRSLTRHLLFGSAEKILFKTSTNNPYAFRDGPTAPTLDALNSMTEFYTDDTTKFKPLAQMPAVSEIDGSLVLLGGPVANLYSRQIFGVGHGSYFLERALGKKENLPIYFDNILTADPHKPGKRPNYTVVIANKYRIECGTPFSNYLVLTSLPNIFSNRYGSFELNSGDRITIISGLNGNGTRAIKSLLHDEKAVDVLATKVGRFEAWQALLKVEIQNLSADDMRIVDVHVFPIQKIDFDLVRSKFEGHCFWVNPDDPLLKI